MQRAFIHCRVSTDEYARQDHHSLDLQEDICREYAQR